MKKVAVLVQNLHNGGAERMAANLSLELAKYYKVYMIVFDGRDAIYPYGGELIDLKVPPLAEGSAIERVKNTLRRVRRLRYLKKKLGIDCTISHMEGANLVNILSRIRDKVYCVYHSMPSMCESGSGLNKLLHRFLAGHCERYLTVSRLAEADMAESFGVDARKLSCIYNFCDLKKIHEWKERELPAEAEAFYTAHPKVLVSMGRLTHMKAQDRLIRMLKELREKEKGLGLLILGEGEERPALLQLAEELDISGHLYLPGEMEDPFPYLKHADVFALPSDYEGLPMVLIEAAACALPVVSADIPSGPREILAPDTDIRKRTEEIEYAKYGILVPSCAAEPRRGPLSEREKLFSGAIGNLLEDPALYRRYRDSSEECAERFSADHIIFEWRELIEKGV